VNGAALTTREAQLRARLRALGRHSKQLLDDQVLLELLSGGSTDLVSVLAEADDTYPGQSFFDFHKSMAEDGFSYVADIAKEDGGFLHVSAHAEDNSMLCAHFRDGVLEHASIQYQVELTYHEMSRIRWFLGEMEYTGVHGNDRVFRTLVDFTHGLRLASALCRAVAVPCRTAWRWNRSEAAFVVPLSGILTEEETLDHLGTSEKSGKSKHARSNVYLHRIESIPDEWRLKWGIDRLHGAHGSAVGGLRAARKGSRP
jgi:hypothetical protein